MKYLPVHSVQRIQEAANSWLTLNMIWQKFGESPDGAVERDMHGAEQRLRDAIAALPPR